MIDLQEINLAIWNRLTLDAAGSALRAALGDGARSIVVAEDIRIEGLLTKTLPARPFIAFRRGPAPTTGRVVIRPIFPIYCYDDPIIGYGRIERLPSLLAGAFAVQLLPAVSGAIGECEVQSGPQTRDAVLDMLLVQVSLTLGAI